MFDDGGMAVLSDQEDPRGHEAVQGRRVPLERGLRHRATTLARERTLPVTEPLAPLLVDGAIQRGTTLAVDGDAAISLALALAVGASRSGSWIGVVGVDGLGLAAAGELGIDLERVVLVADPGPAWSAAVAALIGAVDLVVVAPRTAVPARDARRLATRGRERGTVVVAVGGDVLRGAPRLRASDTPSAGWGLEVDVRFATRSRQWVGLGQGHGRLHARRVEVEAAGRRGASRPRRSSLWLPGPDGRLSAVVPTLAVAPEVTTAPSPAAAAS